MDIIVPLKEQSAIMSIEPNDLLLFARVADDGQLQPRRRADRPAQVDGLAPDRRAGSSAWASACCCAPRASSPSPSSASSCSSTRARSSRKSTRVAALAQHRQAQPSGRLRVSMPSDFANLSAGRHAAPTSSRASGHRRWSSTCRRGASTCSARTSTSPCAWATCPTTPRSRRAASRVFRWASTPRPPTSRGTASRRRPTTCCEHDALRLLRRNGEPARLDRCMHGEQRWEGIPPGRAQRQFARAADPAGARRRRHRRRAGLLRRCRSVRERRTAPRAARLWCLPSHATWAVFPGPRLMPAKTRAFIDMLATALGSVDAAPPPRAALGPVDVQGRQQSTAGGARGGRRA